MNGHSRYAPSSAHRWLRCQLSLQDPVSGHYVADDEEREDAGQGSACHDLAKRAIQDAREPAEYMLEERQFHKRDITADMAANVFIYWRFARGIIELGDYEWYVEHHIEAPKIHEDCEGTADFRAFSEFRKHLIIADYKSGYLDVPDGGKYQLGIYANGELDLLEDLGYEVERISLIIVQPLNKEQPITQTDYTPKELRNIAQELRRATKQNNAVAGTHCRYCVHAPYCDVLAAYANEALPNNIHGPQDFKDLATILTAEQCAEILDRQETVGIWFKAVSAWAQQLITLGETIPGWHLTPGKGNRRYRDAAQAEKVLREHFGDDIYEPRELRSPAQIEAVWPKAKVLLNGKKGQPGLTYRPEIGQTLTRKKE